MAERQIDIVTSRIFSLGNVLRAIPGLAMDRVYGWRRRGVISLPGRSYLFSGAEVVRLAGIFALTELGVTASFAAKIADQVAARATYLTSDMDAPELTEDLLDANVITLVRMDSGEWRVVPDTSRPEVAITIRPDRLARDVIDRLSAVFSSSSR